MSAPYSPKAILNFFLKRDPSITPMKGMKLVYFAHGWHLALYGTPLIDETIETWQYGPVVRSLYDELKKYGSSPIRKLLTERSRSTFLDQVVEVDDHDTQTVALLDQVRSIYGGLTAGQLSTLTHLPDTPWDQVARAHNGSFPRGLDMPDEMIKDYFSKQRAGIQK